MNIRNKRTVWLTRVSFLGAMGFVLMYIGTPLPMFPFFLDLDISDLPSIIGALSLGPMAGVAIQFLKNMIHVILNTKTVGVGEVANFLIGTAYIIPFYYTYKIKGNTKTLILGLLTGTISMVTLAALFNYYFLIPIFAQVMGKDIMEFVNIAAVYNKEIVSLKTMIIYSIVPFNIIKCTVVSTLVFIVYKVMPKLISQNGKASSM